jgi:hypothetical protein
MMQSHQRINADTTTLVSYYPLPGLGILPVNSYVIHAKEPVLVDTGVAVLRADYMKELASVINPQDLRWIWMTHIDADHVGNLQTVLSVAPEARIVTTYLGMGKLGLLQMPLDRVYLLNPGQRLSVGDRELIAVHPPVFDAPETQGFMDTKSRIFFSSDCFGALLSEPAETAANVSQEALLQGMTTWATIDAPWLSSLDAGLFDHQLNDILAMKPSSVLSSHLPPATDSELERMCENLSGARTAPPFVGPDQAALMQMMAAMPA